MEFLGSKNLHEGKHVDFVAKRYRRADGTEVEREIVEHPGSVAVLAHDEEFAYLVAQPREAVEEDELLEIPAGTLDVDGESELECAQREPRRDDRDRPAATEGAAPGVRGPLLLVRSAAGVLPHLAVALGDFPHAAPGLGCVGDGEAGEESHDCLLCRGLRHRLN